MAEIGIVIVTHNSAGVIEACVGAAARANADVLVVDNASSDDTVAIARRAGIRVIANASNIGFAAAVNQGFSVLQSAYVLLLNPDAILTTGVEPLREACDLPGAAGAGGLLVDPGDKPQIGFMVRNLPKPSALILESLLLNAIWPGNPVNVKYRALHLDYSGRQAVEQPAGAFLMIRQAVWKELGGFDEQFWPLWFEDVDFCRRAKDRGYLLYFVPQAVAKHTGGHSIPSLPVEMRRIYWYRSLLRYSAKHFGHAQSSMVCLAVIWGSILRAIGESARERSLRPMAVYSNVVRLAGRFFIGRGNGILSPASHSVG